MRRLLPSRDVSDAWILLKRSIIMLKDLVFKTRSYRRFEQSAVINRETLRELVDLARCSASGVNRQPLKYFLSNEPGKNALIFATLTWAQLLKGWDGPKEGEKPAAYIVILGDKQISPAFGIDPGIAVQSICLGATEKGLGACMLANIKKDVLRKSLAIPERYEILLVIALGKPGEKVVLETVGADGDTAYWNDANDVHHVPKRKLDDIIIG
jgi:nitroreductase